jgi:hypothetical protein
MEAPPARPKTSCRRSAVNTRRPTATGRARRKFGPRRNAHVDIEFSEELTGDWLKNTSDVIVREKQKVLDCFAARKYEGLR